MKKLRKIKVEHKHIRGPWGWAHLEKQKIEVEERLEPYGKLNIIAHELFHIFCPKASEAMTWHFGNEVERIARKLKLLKQEDD